MVYVILRCEPTSASLEGWGYDGCVYVYMLRCADNFFYVGSATGDDLSPRIDQHNAGSYPGYIFTRRPVVLVWSEYFDRITDGIAAERKLKGWSRAKKEALIQSDWQQLADCPGAVRADQSRAELGHPSRLAAQR